jgi:hypothetical protein
MKGRQTSYQRFGSLLGTTGSVVNKFFRSLGKAPNGRDSELAGSIQIDMSDNKGIYNKTLKSDEYLKYDFEKEDLGEEVYGCISHPFGESSIYIEKDSETAIEGRKTKRKDSPHFEDIKREWYHKKANKTYEECALIPQENVPLAVNSKFEMKFWDAETEKNTTIPKGIGFTSGALIRPVCFNDDAVPIEKGFGEWKSLSGFHRAHILQGVPLETAHGIINRCKEISLTGSVNYSITRTNKKCGDGPTTSTKEWEWESLHGCAPGECRDEGGTMTNSCLSGKLVTTIKLAGDIEMTAYRHKQVENIWDKDNQKTLDMSGNVFLGTLEDSALTKKSFSDCDASDAESGIPAPMLPAPTVKQIMKLERQTKLSSACLAYPITNNSIIIAKEDDNLKTDDLIIVNCDPGTAKTYYSLVSPSQTNQVFVAGYFGVNVGNSPLVYPGGASFRIRNTESKSVRPLYISGPSLQCHFSGIGWDYSELGKEEPEVLYNNSKCLPQKRVDNFYDWKMNWKSTNLKKTVDGDCPQGFADVDVYDAEPNSCECDDECEDCAAVPGKLRMNCECQPICAYTPEERSDGNPCADGHKIKIKTEDGYACDGMYGIGFSVGKYVGVQLKDYPYEEADEIYNVASVPLTSKKDAKTEDLVLWWNAFVSESIPYDFYKQTSSDLQLELYANKESVDHAMKDKLEDSFYKYEPKKVGSLKIQCDDWSTSTDIWVIHRILKETSCIPFGPGADGNREVRTRSGVPYTACIGCGSSETCCSDRGCGGGNNSQCCEEDLCGLATSPCGWSAQTTSSRGGCDGNAYKDCSGSCKFLFPEECGCCGCIEPEPDGTIPPGSDCFIPCTKEYLECKPYTLISDFEPLSCYGDANEEDKHATSIDLTIEFKLFGKDEME